MNKYDTWDNYDEDGYPAGDDYELEYVEDWESENDEEYLGYTPVQGNWDPRDYDDTYSFEKKGRKYKMHSVKTYSESQTKTKKLQKIKQRAQAKAKEKQRQKYYHYKEDTKDEV